VGDDITYIPMAHGCVYLAAVLDWASRRVLSWRVSVTLDNAFCIAARRGGHRPVRSA
jgi:putative transposase